MLLAVFSACTFIQAGRWKSSVTLFEHALAVTENNHMAHHRLAVALAEEGRLEEAVEHNLEALRIMPGFAGAYSVIKFHLAELELFPGEAAYVAGTHNALGDIFAGRADMEKAAFHYTEAVRVGPDHVPALISIGVLYGRAGSYDAAIEMFARVAALEPENPLAYYNMGLAYERKGLTDEAVRNYGKALELRPDYAEPMARLMAIDRAAQ